MCKNQFDGTEFELSEQRAFYETFNDFPENRRKEVLEYIYSLSPIKYKNFVEMVLSKHPDYDPEKYKIED